MKKLILKILFCNLLFNFAAQTNDASQPKQYQQMTEPEQLAYIKSKLPQIAGKMTKQADREFPDEAIEIIKYWLDAYARRIGNGGTRHWGEDLNFMFLRARTQFVPTIIQAFQDEQAPILLGVYLPVIETEYRNISSVAGAAGLFQFIAPMATKYGIKPSERTKVEKMAPAVARYLKHRFAEFGTDITGLELSLAAYNRAPRAVMRDLKQVSNGQEKPTFWTLVKNKDKLDDWFQKETINYVPRFYAAAIIGENPADFGIVMKPLSSYAKAEVQWSEPQVIQAPKARKSPKP